MSCLQNKSLEHYKADFKIIHEASVSERNCFALRKESRRQQIEHFDLPSLNRFCQKSYPKFQKKRRNLPKFSCMTIFAIRMKVEGQSNFRPNIREAALVPISKTTARQTKRPVAYRGHLLPRETGAYLLANVFFFEKTNFRKKMTDFHKFVR
jgi:hypothetical protein